MLRTIALVVAALVASLSGARADVIAGSQKKIQGWTLAAYTVKGRGFNHCGIFVNYRSGITLHFVMFASRIWSIGWSHDSWAFRQGQRVPLQLHVDGAGPYNLTAIAQARDFILAEQPAGAALYDIVRRGSQMTIQTPGGRMGFALDGTSAGLSELTACVDRFTGVARSPQVPVPHVPVPQAAAPQASAPMVVAAPPMPPASSSTDDRPLGNKLGDAQALQLHEAICSSRVYKAKEGKKQFWACDRPRDYPTRTANGTCRLHVPALDDGRYTIFYGRFTALRTQAIAMYAADCEPRATNNGGAALFDVTDGNFRFVRYFVGHRYYNCVVPPALQGETQTPYCLSSFMGQGQLSQSFGPVKYGLDGEVKQEAWLSAGNVDGARGPMAFCQIGKPDQPDLHHLIGARWDEDASRVVVEAGSLDPRSHAAACDRFRRGEFNAEEKRLRETSILARDGAFLRDGEDKYVKVLARFRPGDKTPEIELTSEPVQQR